MKRRPAFPARRPALRLAPHTPATQAQFSSSFYAAEALALEPAMVAKTLVAELDDGFAFALVPGDRELSLRALARAAGSRSATLAAERDAQRLTGYQIGGISPFGSRSALPVFAVAAWLARERVALNGGARGVILELASADLVRVLSPTAIPE